MRVLKVLEKERYALELRCKLMLHAQRVDVDERILIDRGDCILGPMRIVEARSQYAAVLADEGFNYFRHIDGNDLEPDALEPIFMPEEYYESTTGNIYLDGFLRASYYDKKNLLHADISTKYCSLVKFYGSALDECGITFHQVKDGFIVDDDKAVESVFESYGPCMPIRYIIGYISSFIALARISQNSNPKYARYQFSLIDEYLEDDVIIPRFFENSMKGQRQLFSYFGSMDPLVSLIDEVDTEENIDSDAKDSPTISFRKETLPEIIRLMFYYSGHSPIIRDAEVQLLSVRESALSDDRKIVCLIDNDDIPCPCDYAIRDTGTTVEIGKVSGKVCKYFVGLFNNPWFDFGREMSNYFEIMIKKL